MFHWIRIHITHAQNKKIKKNWNYSDAYNILTANVKWAPSRTCCVLFYVQLSSVPSSSRTKVCSAPCKSEFYIIVYLSSAVVQQPYQWQSLECVKCLKRISQRCRCRHRRRRLLRRSSAAHLRGKAAKQTNTISTRSDRLYFIVKFVFARFLVVVVYVVVECVCVRHLRRREWLMRLSFVHM